MSLSERTSGSDRATRDEAAAAFSRLPRPIVCSLITAAAVAVLLPAAAPGALRTTAPDSTVTVLVLITNNGIKLFPSSGAINLTTGAYEPGTYIAFKGPIPRGDYLHFNILNRSTSVENFTVLGRRTGPIAPGHRAHFSLLARSRGRFLYQSTLATDPRFRGYLEVT